MTLMVYCGFVDIEGLAWKSWNSEMVELQLESDLSYSQESVAGVSVRSDKSLYFMLIKRFH